MELLQEIFYLNIYAKLPPQYIEELTLFEKEFYIHLLKEELKKEQGNG